MMHGPRETINSLFRGEADRFCENLMYVINECAGDNPQLLKELLPYVICCSLIGYLPADSYSEEEDGVYSFKAGRFLYVLNYSEEKSCEEIFLDLRQSQVLDKIRRKAEYTRSTLILIAIAIDKKTGKIKTFKQETYKRESIAILKGILYIQS